MKKIWVQLLVITIMFSGCDKLIAPSSIDLGHGYIFDLSEGYDGAQILGSNNSVLIRSVVFECTFDSTFIIASQCPWDTILHYSFRNATESGRDFDTCRQYWIINKKQENKYIRYDRNRRFVIYSNVYGPFDMSEYLQKRQELGVPEKLQLTGK